MIAVIGLLLMLHSAVSIAQFRDLMRNRGEPDFSLPFDILAECILGLILASYGWTSELAAFQDISKDISSFSSDVTMQKKSIEALLYRPGFYSRVVRRWGFYEEKEDE